MFADVTNDACSKEDMWQMELDMMKVKYTVNRGTSFLITPPPCVYLQLSVATSSRVSVSTTCPEAAHKQ